MSKHAEHDLIARAAKGDRRAQAGLVSAHMPRSFALAVRMLGNVADAEDVVQDAFIRAWTALPKWEPRAKFSTWLHRVTLNLCYDRLRKQREISGEDALPDRADPGLSPQDALDQSQRVASIEGAIAALPDRQRAALVLCRLEGHTNVEAAEIMETSVDALESLLARARRTLKVQLLKDEKRAGDA